MDINLGGERGGDMGKQGRYARVRTKRKGYRGGCAQYDGTAARKRGNSIFDGFEWLSWRAGRVRIAKGACSLTRSIYTIYSNRHHIGIGAVRLRGIRITH